MNEFKLIANISLLERKSELLIKTINMPVMSILNRIYMDNFTNFNMGILNIFFEEPNAAIIGVLQHLDAGYFYAPYVPADL